METANKLKMANLQVNRVDDKKDSEEDVKWTVNRWQTLPPVSSEAGAAEHMC